MRCPNCGHEVKEGQAFCSHCGAALPKRSQARGGAGQEAHSSARPNICPRCGSSLPEGSEFCPNCGTRVAGPAENDTVRRDPSHTQAMPVLPQNPPRVEAVPSPPQEGYSTRGGSKRPSRGGSSKTPLIVAGVIVAVAAVAIAVMAALGAGPFQGSDGAADSQATTETTNGSVIANDNDNTSSNAGNSNVNSNASASNANSNATSNGNANQNANATSPNANSNSSAGNGNANANSNASNAANSANANAGDDDGTSGSVTLNGGYVSNSNSTYGYSLTVPTSFTLSGSDSAGNATLTDTASPCVITVSVDNNPSGYTVDQALANASAGASSGAYTAKGNGWYVFSDEPNGSVYYVMSYVQQGRTISLRFSYPTSAKSQCDPIIESVQPTFSVN